MADYKDSLEYLRKIAVSKLGLERITELCERLGNPQNRTKIIHVAGTNGKGSFCTMISAILRDSGYKVGGFSSPALTEVTDSFRINGNEISRDDFAEIMTDIIPECEAMDDKPTEFEVLTALAFELFARKKCDIAVIECGMGGDTDSTNVISSPLLSVITNIAVDHVSFLGNTVQEIASHKAGIIKSNRPVLYGGNNADALKIISNTAEKSNSAMTVTNHGRISNIYSDIHGISLDFSGFGTIHTSMSGTYQQYNIANVLTAVEILRNEGLNIPENAVKSGLLSARLHGRFELISENPIIIFDGSHNPDGINQAAASIERYFGDKKIVLLIGVMADKDYQLYPKILGKYIDRVYTVKPDNPRALDATTLLLAFQGIHGAAFDDLDKVISCAVNYAVKNNIPLIALGSLYMYKDFIKNLNLRNLHG